MNKYVFWGIVGVSATIVLVSVIRGVKAQRKTIKVDDAKLQKEADELIARIAQQDY